VLAQIGLAEPGGSRRFTQETVPVLRGLLADNNEDVIAAAIHALAHHRYVAVEDLREFAQHPSRPIREALAHALTGHDEGEVIALLMELMTDADDTVRDWATFAIGSQCDADGLHIRQALVDRLADSDEEIRGEAMVGLARRRDTAVVDYVAEALGGPNPGQLVFDAAEEILSAFPEEGRIRAALARWRAE
jgi:HEAT repeat protein